MHLHLVLAGGPVHPRTHHVRSGACPVHEGDSWRQGQERQAGFAEDCIAVQGRHAAAGLCVSGRYAPDARSSAPAHAHVPAARTPDRPYPEYGASV